MIQEQEYHHHDEEELHQQNNQEEEQEGQYETAFVHMSMDSYKQYFDKINKVLEQSSQLTSSMFKDENGYQLESNYEGSENKMPNDQQYIDEQQKKALEHQLFYGLQSIDEKPQPSFNENTTSLSQENTFHQNRFDQLSQEISNRIQERAMITVTEQSNQFDLHTIEEEDINEEDISIDKKEKMKKFNQMQSLHQESIENNSEVNNHSGNIVIQNSYDQTNENQENQEDLEERHNPPHPIPQELEPKQIIVVKGNRYHIQHTDLQQLQEQQQSLQNENLQQQNPSQLKQFQNLDKELFHFQQIEQQLEEQQQDQEQSDEERQLEQQQEEIYEDQEIENENENLECNEQEEMGYEQDLNQQQQEALEAFIQQQNHQLAQKQQLIANKASNLQQSIEGIQKQSEQYKGYSYNTRNDQQQKKGLTIQDLIVKNDVVGYSHKSKANESNYDRINSAQQIKASNSTSHLKKKINNYVKQQLSTSNTTASSTKNQNSKRNILSPEIQSIQKKKNGINSYFLQEQVSPQQYLQPPSPKEYQSAYSQSQAQSMYNYQNTYYYQQEQKNYNLQESELDSIQSQQNNRDNSKFQTLYQLQQEKLRLEKIKYHKIIKEQQEEREKKNLRQSRQNKDYCQQNSYNQISTSISNQNEYFPTNLKTQQGSSSHNFNLGQSNNNTSNNSAYLDDQSSNSYLNSFKMKKKQMSLSNLSNQQESLQNHLSQNQFHAQQFLAQDPKIIQISAKSPQNLRVNAQSPQRNINKDYLMNGFSQKDVRNKKTLQEKNQYVQPTIDINVMKKITQDIAKQQAQKIQKDQVDQNTQREARRLIQNGQVADAINRMVLKTEKNQRSSSSRTPSKQKNGNMSKIISLKTKEQDIQRYQYATVENTNNLKPKKSAKQQKNMSNNYFASYFNESPIKKQSTPNKFSAKDHTRQKDDSNQYKNTGNIGMITKDYKSNTSNQSLTSRNQLNYKNSSNNSHSSVQLKTLLL